MQVEGSGSGSLPYDSPLWSHRPLPHPVVGSDPAPLRAGCAATPSTSLSLFSHPRVLTIILRLK